MPKDSSSELFYLVDNQDNVLGSISRQEAHSSNLLIHRSVQIILFNNERDSILLQKRGQAKDLYPGWWTISASGHVTYGDSYKETADRELFEEIGVVTTLQYQKKYLEKNSIETELLAIFTGQYNQLPTQLDPHEVEKVAWCRLDQLTTFVKENLFTFTGARALRELQLLA